MITIRYTQWDGTQRIRLEADRVFEKLSEALSATDDVHQALEWLLRQGAEWNGVRVIGLDDLLEAAREQLRQRYREYNLKDPLEQIRRRLEDLLDLERQTLGEQRASGSDVTQKLAFLDHLPQPLSEALEHLRSYEFEDAQAGQEFESLLEELQDLKDLEEFRRRFGDL